MTNIREVYQRSRRLTALERRNLAKRLWHEADTANHDACRLRRMSVEADAEIALELEVEAFALKRIASEILQTTIIEGASNE